MRIIKLFLYIPYHNGKLIFQVIMKRNLKIAVDYEYRAVPLFMQAKRIINEQKLDEPFFVKLDWLMSSRANPARPWNWYSDTDSGGGVLGALGTHAFDMIHWLIGPTDSLSAINSTSIKERFCPLSKKNKPVTSEDVSISQLKIKTIHNNLIPCQVNLSAVTKQSKGFSLEIYGTNGTLILSSDNQKDYVHGFSLWFSPSTLSKSIFGGLLLKPLCKSIL